MKEKLDFSKVPYQYAMCLNQQCPKANTCLRQLAERSAPQNIEHWMIISPKHLSSLDGDCPYYRSSIKVSYAKGFIHLLDNMPHKLTQTVAVQLMNYFGRRTYYRTRKGERLIPPSEQQDICNILKSCGIAQAPKFDEYIKDYDW